MTVKPEALAGNWLFEMKVGGRSVEGSIHFTVVAGVLAGSLTHSDGNERELSNIKLDGDRISWDLGGERAGQHAEGTIAGGSMKGTMKWKRSAGGRGSRGHGSDEDSEEAPPPAGGFRGGRGRGGGRGGSGGRSSEITWTAYKTVESGH